MSWSCENCGKGHGECHCTDADYNLANLSTENIEKKLDRIIDLLETISKEMPVVKEE